MSNRGILSLYSFKGHPKGLFYLFFAEMWERFSFYGMRGLLVLYMTQRFLFTDERAYETYAGYMALVYGIVIFGGWIADNYLGNRKAIMLGGIIIALGHLLLTLDDPQIFYLGLAAITVGTGFYKANISTLLGQLYNQGDWRRDSGFTLFYVGINLGSLLASLACGIVANKYGWSWGFSIAAFGMVAGLFAFGTCGKYLDGKGEVPEGVDLNKKTMFGLSIENTIRIGALVLIPILAYCLNHPGIFDALLPVAGVGGVAYMLYHAQRGNPQERSNLLVILVLMVFQMVFFSLFEQAGSSLSLFTDRNVDRSFGLTGVNFSAPEFQSLNPLFIIFLGPLFSGLWLALGRRKLEPSTPFKFFLALIQVALGFVALLAGIQYAPATGLTHAGWLVLAYFLHSTAELCISPIGLSLVTKLAPQRILSTVMGLWFLSIAFSHYVSGLFSKLAAIPKLPEGQIETTAMVFDHLRIYSSAFKIVAIFAFVMAGILFVLIPFLLKPFQEQTSIENEKAILQEA